LGLFHLILRHFSGTSPALTPENPVSVLVRIVVTGLGWRTRRFLNDLIADYPSRSRSE
jgi:hypothetical protein